MTSKIFKKVGVKRHPIRIGKSSHSLSEVAIVERGAKDIIAAAEKRAALIEKEAFDSGQKKAHEKMKIILEQERATIIEQGRMELETTLQGLEEDILRLAIAIAEKICRKEISQDKTIVLELVRQSLKNLGKTKSATIRVHPSEFGEVEKQREALLGGQKKSIDLEILGDESIEPGGCIVENGIVTVDAQLGTRLVEVEHGLSTHEDSAHGD